MRRIAALVFAALACGCASSRDPGDGWRASPARTAWIVGRDGAAIGQATFTDAPRGVLIHLEFLERSLPPGWHGLHLHTRGDCSDFAAGFQAAGGHLGMADAVAHGLLNPAGPEAGDLPNLFAGPTGVFGAEFFTPYVTLEPRSADRRPALLDSDGSALIVHANADDQTTQPTGGSGDRIACIALTALP